MRTTKVIIFMNRKLLYTRLVTEKRTPGVSLWVSRLRARKQREKERKRAKISAFREPRSQQEATENKRIMATDGHRFGTKLMQNRKITTRDGRSAETFGEVAGCVPLISRLLEK